MKRLWHHWLAMVAVVTMSSVANAQWNQSGEIGSYQSILARAGYGQVQQPLPGAMPGNQPPAQHVQAPMPNMPAQSVTSSGCQGGCGNLGGCGGTAVGCGGAIRYGNPGYGTGVGYGSGNAFQHQAGVANNAVSMPNQPMIPGALPQPGAVNGGMVGGANAVAAPLPNYTDYGPVASNVCGNGVVVGGGYAPVYSPGVGAGLSTSFIQRTGLAGGRGVNRVGSVFGVIMRRNYEDGIHLACAPTCNIFQSTEVDLGDMTGMGASLATRSGDGNGWEATYWGIDEDHDVSLAGPTTTNIVTLMDLNHVPSGYNVEQIYDAGSDARFYRDMELHNVEFNLLRNGGRYTTRRGLCGNFELLGGVRLMQFDESFRYVSNTMAPGYPQTMDWQLQAENFLIGLQLGGRNEICLSERLRLAGGLSVGLFNNHVDMTQRIVDETGYSPLLASGPSAGRPYDYMGEKDDAAVLGQLDLGLIYQLSCKFRARVGYRAMGVSGVALAVDQIPYSFNDPYFLQRPNTNGSLLMHGFYFGSEFCF